MGTNLIMTPLERELSMFIKPKTLHQIVKASLVGLVVVTFVACESQNTDSIEQADLLKSTYTPAIWEKPTYIKPDQYEDKDRDGIQDKYDLEPLQETVFAEEMGSQAFIFDSVFGKINGRLLENTVVKNSTIQINLLGAETHSGPAWVIFETVEGYRAQSPEIINSELWQIKVPDEFGQIRGIHLAKGNYRTRSIDTDFIYQNQPIIYPYLNSVSAAETIQLDGINLAQVEQVKLGLETLEIVDKTDTELTVIMPTSAMTSELSLLSGNTSSNKISLSFTSTVQLSIDESIGTNHTYQTYLGSEIYLKPGFTLSMTVSAHQPTVLNWRVKSSNSAMPPTTIKSLILPGQEHIKVGPLNSLMAELYQVSHYLKLAPSNDWNDVVRQFSSFAGLDQAKSYISAMQSHLNDATDIDRNVHIRSLIKQINSTTKLASENNLKLDGGLGDNVVSVVSHRATYGQSSFVGFELSDKAGCDLSALSLFGSTPDNQWPSDLCITNSSSVYASVAVYKGDSPVYDKSSDRISTAHINSVLDTGTLGSAWGVFSLFDSIIYPHTPDNKPLCRLQKCYVEILTGGLTPYKGIDEFDVALTEDEKKVIAQLKGRFILEKIIQPAIQTILSISDPGISKCISDNILKDKAFYIPTTVNFARDLNQAVSLSDKYDAFDKNYGAYLYKNLLSEPTLVNSCLAPIASSIQGSLQDKAVTVVSNLGVYIKVAGFAKTAYELFIDVLTPEKIVYLVDPAAQIVDVSPGEIDLLDSVDGRSLTISGRNLGTASNLIIQDAGGLIATLPLRSEFLMPSNIYQHYTLTEHRIPLSELFPLLTDMSSSDITFSMQIDGSYPGYDYPDYPQYDDSLVIPPSREVLLRTVPKIYGSTPYSASVGQLVEVIGERFTHYDSEGTLLTMKGEPITDSNGVTTSPEFQTAPIILNDQVLKFYVPYNVPTGDYEISISDATPSAMRDELVMPHKMKVNEKGLPSITFSDRGPDIDDLMIIELIDSDGETVILLDETGTPVDNPDGTDYGFRVIPTNNGTHYLSIIWDYALFGERRAPAAIKIRCVNPSNKNINCTYRIKIENARIAIEANAAIEDQLYEVKNGSLGKSQEDIYIIYPQ